MFGGMVKSVSGAVLHTVEGTKVGYDEKTHRRFSTVSEYVNELGGEHGRVIEKILISNNGNAAIKAIRSIRRWAYDMFGDPKAITFVVMATPEDLRSNAEYIRMGDVIVDVPGGSNNHNYANVNLIVELARLHRVHAVWAGWGHASENPLLPDSLAKSDPPIKFIGPAGPPMRALGDKIGSTIIAQSAGVPCIAWNGSNVKAEYDKERGELPVDAFRSACVHSASEAATCAQTVGFPIMIKASEGGGGKGIRKVLKAEDVQDAYRQVSGEVPGSPIFIMKLCSDSRHLEVQLLADEYGDAIALNGRDCSVQRRHQKIIEEGPPIAADPSVWPEMEKAAVALAKAVGYHNAGTVEYLYSESTKKFYFLELNPRLQVEHPVTEMITKVNIPAAQLQVAMGIPLKHIPDIRELYGKTKFEEPGPVQEEPINFDTAERMPPVGHCIAVRITAENAEAGFKPTSGGIQELNFRSTPNVWGYFSMDSSGSIHEFADSQFGHLFASGTDREMARRNMVLALKELSIRGDISTTVDYVSKLIELDDFISNKIDTAWLDGLIANKVITEGGKAESPKNPHINVVLGAVISVFDTCQENETQFRDLLKKGQLPPMNLLAMKQTVELILDGTKYILDATRTGPDTFRLSIAGNPELGFMETSVRMLSDGGYLIAVGGKSHVAYLTTKGDVATGMRLSVAGATVLFSPDYDPSSLRTDVAGKLVKRLVPDGARVGKGEAFAEIEVMKMFMPLKVDEAGVISWCANEGAAMSAGTLMATLELENPENVASVIIHDGALSVEGWTTMETNSNGTVDPSGDSHPHLMLRKAMSVLTHGMAGYILEPSSLQAVMEQIRAAVSNPMLPVFEISENLSVLSGRIDANLFAELSTMISDFKALCQGKSMDEIADLRFAADKVVALIEAHKATIGDESEYASFVSSTSALMQAATPYVKTTNVMVGSERALTFFLELLRNFIAVELYFTDGISYADAVDNLRKARKDEFDAVLDIVRSHSQLKSTVQTIKCIIEAIAEGSLTGGSDDSLVEAEPCLSGIGAMDGNSYYAEVALMARKLLLKESLPSITKRQAQFSEKATVLADGTCKEAEVVDFVDENIPMSDVFFPLLKNTSGDARVALVELYARKLYQQTYSLKDITRSDEASMTVTMVFTNKEKESVFSAGLNKATSMQDVTAMIRSSTLGGGMGSMGGGGLSGYESDSEKSTSSSNSMLMRVADTEVSGERVGVFKVIGNLEEIGRTEAFDAILQTFPQYNNRSPKSSSGPTNVLHLYVLEANAERNPDAMDAVAEQLQEMLSGYENMLIQADVSRVTFNLCCKTDTAAEVEYPLPTIFVFRKDTHFKEDVLFRDIEPSHAYHLDLLRLGKNFSVKSTSSSQTSTSHVHVYKATPRRSALEKDKKANPAPRSFARVLAFVQEELTSSKFEKILIDALNGLDLSECDGGDNHLFMNLVGYNEKTVMVPMAVEQAIVSILSRHAARIQNLGVAEIETRIVCRVGPDSPPISLRMVASNPTGFVLVMNTYVEAAANDEEPDKKRVFKLVGDDNSAGSGSGPKGHKGDGSWEGLDVTTPYPLTRPFDAQRKAAARSSDTLYCYDIPALFEAAVEQKWATRASQLTNNNNQSTIAASRPAVVMQTSELIVTHKGEGGQSWTMADYLDGKLQMVQVKRGAGANDVGMVAWLVTLKTVEYPDGRQVVLIANDITHKAGSFGTREDVVFKMASQYARQRRIPRLYVAANSGARIGTAESVKSAFQVAFKDADKPENGFHYLYLNQAEFDELSRHKSVLAEKTTSANGEVVYKITDIIGSEPDLGVENLKGSGLIAGETSAAYNDIFTLTIVLGRTVGIGAYLVRLGQRTIQKKSNSPIILTGYQALNKLMGVEVYSTNDQLGGPAIMFNNGVSHMVAGNHLRAIEQTIEWLSYVPSVREGMLPITDISGVDQIERPIEFCPKPGVPYDPRQLLTGCESENDGGWSSGFFDKGSFTEALAGWARSVIVGRARLGGMPMGVIVTENRTAENIKPADPADMTASEAVIQEAGGVWFPNSAYKTAQAINDFRTEDLPIMIFANWRGFSGGQRDMFDEVLKYGSLIVDAFVAFEQPIFVCIPPYGEIRGGAWVVLDASINAAVMEMYSTAGTARGGVLEANGAASVKYRTKDMLKTMHRLDPKLKSLDQQLADGQDVAAEIKSREKMLLPVYEQIAVQFCDLHDTPGRMEAVGVIQKQVEWAEARTFFFWRLRRKLAEFDLRKKMCHASVVGGSASSQNHKLTPIQASALMKSWFLASSPHLTEDMWEDDKTMLSWMAQSYNELEARVVELSKQSVVHEVEDALTRGGAFSQISTAGIVEGIARAYQSMNTEQKASLKAMMTKALE